MTSTAAGPVVPWAARLPWVLLAVSSALAIAVSNARFAAHASLWLRFAAVDR